MWDPSQHKEGTRKPIPDISIQGQFDWFGPQKLGVYWEEKSEFPLAELWGFPSAEYSWSSDSALGKRGGVPGTVIQQMG